ncbi:hypothetical protein ACHAXT_010610 [Thalassiosira profunda]
MPNRLASVALLALCGGAGAFAPQRSAPIAIARSAAARRQSVHPQHISCTNNHKARWGAIASPSLPATAIDDIPVEEWTPLVDAIGENEMSPVRKHILQEGGGECPPKGSTVEIEYAGTLLGETDWSASDVVECWLSQLQGLDHLSPTFAENAIDGAKLMDDSFFTEGYCMETLGISNKIQAKKLIMASKRLTKQQSEYPAGTEFDSSISRGKTYAFQLGKGKAIKAIDLAVAKMRVGERAVVACRSDYGYGAEGLRTSKGDVLVPPFASLCFEIELVSAA